MTEFLIDQPIIDQEDIEDADDVGSFNHSYLQMKLGAMLIALNKYTVCAELSLDISNLDSTKYPYLAANEIKPDIAVYPPRGLSRPFDILRMTEMPLMVVEILSPKQGTYHILEKFAVYFELGVQSCWLVDPATEIITIYSSLHQYQTFSAGELVDETLNIHLPLTEIFT